MDNISFYTYRYFIIPSLQVTFEQMTISDKRLLIKNIFVELTEKKKIEKDIKGKKYILYFRKQLSDDVYICKFVKEVTRDKHDIGLVDIEENKESDYPFIYIIVDTSKQIFFIQDKRTVFRNIDYAKNRLEAYFDEDLVKKDFNLTMDAITESKSFWEHVNSAEKIYELKLNMKSPNAFDGILNANKLLKKIRSFFNNTEMDMNLKNEDGNLNINEGNSKDYIDYIKNGAGTWQLAIGNNNDKDRAYIKSTDDIYIKRLRLPNNFENILNSNSDETYDEIKKLKSKIIYFKDILGDKKDILGEKKDEEDKNKDNI